MSKREERLVYLKEVKRKEVAERIWVARELGDLENNEAYISARIEQAKIENEIFELESLISIEYDRKQSLSESKENKEILEFLGNNDFALANRYRKFTPEEEVVIILHSDKVSLEKKIEELEKRKAFVCEQQAEAIDSWISHKREILKKIKKINQSDIIFVVTFVDGNDGKNFSMYCRTYELAMEKVVSNTLYIDIERIQESKEKQRMHLGRISFATADGCKRISDVNYSEENSLKRTVKKKGAFDDVKVKLNNPYKPYDLLKVPAWFGYFVYFVVADVTNPRVKQFMEENSHMDDDYAGWAEIAMPTWFLETTNYAAVPYNHINLSYEFETFAWPLSYIKKVEERDMTMGQVNMIKEIKRQVEETDNLNKIHIKRG